MVEVRPNVTIVANVARREMNPSGYNLLAPPFDFVVDAGVVVVPVVGEPAVVLLPRVVDRVVPFKAGVVAVIVEVPVEVLVPEVVIAFPSALST